MSLLENDSRSSSTAEEVALVVRAVLEAIKRIPPHLKGTTFFSANDQWFYIAMSDDRVCPECDELNGGIFDGNYLRYVFPWLRVMDEDTIFPMVHPHCRCILHRIASLM